MSWHVVQVADKAMQWQPYTYSPNEVKRNDPNKKRRWLIPLVLAAQIAFKVGHQPKCCGSRSPPGCHWSRCPGTACTRTHCSFSARASADALSRYVLGVLDFGEDMIRSSHLCDGPESVVDSCNAAGPLGGDRGASWSITHTTSS